MKPILLVIGSNYKNQGGISLVIVAIFLFLFIGVSALAIDLSHLYLVRNELQNAADAGALAGAKNLYSKDPSAGVVIQVAVAKNAAVATATANKALAENQGPYPVEVDPNTDVKVGHWAFGIGSLSKDFYPYTGTNPQPPDLTLTTPELDQDPNFINAVEVTANRNAFPVATLFAKIFNQGPFTLSAKAVAYIGYAGSLKPGEVDEPIAICKQAITNPDGSYTCSYGRMIPNGEQTGAWTNFSQEPCSTATGGASSGSVPALVCQGGNQWSLTFGAYMGTTNGEVDQALTNLINCWIGNNDLDTDDDNLPDQPWKLTLAVIDCEDGKICSNEESQCCSKLVGVVTLNILWISYTNGMNSDEVELKHDGTVQKYPQYPRYMTAPDADGNPVTFDFKDDTTHTDEEIWSEFADAFNLKDISDPNNITAVTHEDKSIYFLPDCTPHFPTGNTGGENFGVLAEIPVLVK